MDTVRYILYGLAFCLIVGEIILLCSLKSLFNKCKEETVEAVQKPLLARMAAIGVLSVLLAVIGVVLILL